MIIDDCVIDEFLDDALVAWYNLTHRTGGTIQVIAANTSGAVWSENMLRDLNATQIVYLRYNITIPAGAWARIQFSQNNVTWVNSDGIAQWENMTDGEHTILLIGLNWGGNFYYRVAMHKTGGGVSPSLDYVQVCFKTTEGYGWNILMFPMIAVFILIAVVYVRKR